MHNVHTEERGLCTIHIDHDEHTHSPADWGDDGVTLLTDHRQCYIKSSHFTADEARAIVSGESKEPKEWYIFPVTAYIHSGVALSLSRDKYPFNDKWDSCTIGIVGVRKDEAKTRKAAQKVAEGHISTWNDYLSGSVYAFTVEDSKTGELVVSCGGFYGDYEEDGGALDEARTIADVYTVTNKEKARDCTCKCGNKHTVIGA